MMRNVKRLTALSKRRLKVIVRETKEVARIAIGAIMLGGIIKEDWLKSNIFVWIGFFLLVLGTIWLGEKQDEYEN